MITGLDHVNIRTTDLAATRAFYEAGLGLTKGPRPNVPVDGVWLYAADRPVVHVAVAAKVDGPASAPVPGGIDHFSFEVADFDAAVARLEAASIPYRAIDLPNGFGRQAFLTDPNGVAIELTWRAR